jgi:carbamoyltransferase
MNEEKKDIWIAGITRGHNGGVCLLKNGEIVFATEEERYSRRKYDGGPLAAMIKIKEYTDKLDYIVVAHTQSLVDTCGFIDFTGDDMYTGLARKLGLIDRKFTAQNKHGRQHPQVLDFSHMHHRLHAACAFYRSGFEEAVALIVDGAGTFIPMEHDGKGEWGWEVESIFNCAYPANFDTIFKSIGMRGPTRTQIERAEVQGEVYDSVIHDRAGIVKVYEATTEYCGFSAIEAGKTMGLFPYGEPNDNIPKLFQSDSIYPLSNRNMFIPTYPNSAILDEQNFEELKDGLASDLTKLQNRRDMAYACQTQTQDAVVRYIRKAVELSGKNNVVISGGYGLNCVANYHYLEALKDEGINIYVEPISNDAGTAIGAALMAYRHLTEDTTNHGINHNLYLGATYHYEQDEINSLAEQYGASVTDATHQDVIDLITSKNIVSVFQGGSEAGPRALGNRSILYDPTDPDGKDFVNQVKRREYFRPFAGSILEEDVHEWFDLRGMESSPTMMYAVNCQPGIEEKIPAIIHVDGTCRIQTVNREQNPHYYDLIKTFKDKTGCPIIFNTSFNLGGEPLVETLEDALWTLQESDIEYCYLPEYGKLLSIKNA